MRNVLIFVGCMFVSGLIYAQPSIMIKGHPADGNQIVRVNSSSAAVVASFWKSSAADTYVVSVPSFSASTELRAENLTRTGITITNYGGQIVFISTYSGAATTNMFPLAANGTIGDEFADNVNPYTGAWYALTIAAQAAQDIRVFEKSE